MLLNESDRATARHYLVLGMAWAGWVFDFYDLMLFSFLLVDTSRWVRMGDAR